MYCPFFAPLIRMARNIRVARARAQPVPGFPALPEYPPLPFLFIFAPIIAHFSHKSFQ